MEDRSRLRLRHIGARNDTTQQSGQIPDKGVEIKNITVYLDDWLTMHCSITLVDLQLDAQNSYLFTYNTFIKILYMFRALPCSSSRGPRRNFIYAASGIVTLCR